MKSSGQLKQVPVIAVAFMTSILLTACAGGGEAEVSPPTPVPSPTPTVSVQETLPSSEEPPTTMEELSEKESYRKAFQQSFYTNAQDFLTTGISKGFLARTENPYFIYEYQIEPQEQKYSVTVYSNENLANPLRELYCENTNDTETCWTKYSLLPNPEEWYLFEDSPTLTTQWLPTGEDTETLSAWLIANALNMSNCDKEDSILAYDEAKRTYTVESTTEAPAGLTDTVPPTQQSTTMVFTGNMFTVLSESANPDVPENFINTKIEVSHINDPGYRFDTSKYPTTEEKASAQQVTSAQIREIEQQQNNAPAPTPSPAE